MPKTIFKLDVNNISSLSFNFPFFAGIIYQDFYNFNLLKYYTPAINYDLIEEKYFLGVFQTPSASIENLDLHINALEDKNFSSSTDYVGDIYRNSILFISDSNGDLLWTWDLYYYIKENDLTLFNHPIIETASRLGKNNLGLYENDIVISISKLNLVLIINPINNNIDLKIDSSLFNRTITSFCDAHIIPFGLPGAGNLLFYNHNRNNENLTEILEYDIINKRVVFEYSSEEFLNSNRSIVGSVQKLYNGNYFIYNYEKNILFEIDSQGKLIFHYRVLDETPILTFKEKRFSRSFYCSKAQQVPYEWVEELIKNHNLINEKIANWSC
ncbi:MAG: hypothetical protein IKT40_06165 [Bacilli bacterium]|nr:hypothetical protein [Bacilli bacterium]